MKALFLLFTLATRATLAGEVIDVGKYQVQGTMRGPEVQYIDSEQIDAKTASKFVGDQLKQIEQSLLVPTKPFKEIFPAVAK